MNKFKVGDEVRSIHFPKETSVVVLMPGDKEYERRHFAGAHLGFVLEDSGWYYQKDWELVEQTYTKLTTEYPEPVEKESSVTHDRNMEILQGAITSGGGGYTVYDRTADLANNPLYVTGMDIGKIEHGSIFKMPQLNKTKLTTMQKLTSALKRVLSADKQTLYKAGVIGQDLTLTGNGRAEYTSALFDNEGDHKKAVAQMVEDAQAYIDEAKN